MTLSLPLYVILSEASIYMLPHSGDLVCLNNQI